jgi:hypothetical protein
MSQLKHSLASVALLALCAYGCGPTGDGGHESGNGGESGNSGESGNGGESGNSGESGNGGESGNDAAEGGATAGDSTNGANAGATGEDGGAAGGESGANAGGAGDAGGEPNDDAGSPNGGAASGGGDTGCGGQAAATANGGGNSPVALAAIDYVSPNVAYLGEQQAVIIRGENFPQNAKVCFGNRRAASVEVVSGSEIRAIPPVIGTPGHLSVTLGSATELAYSHAELVVRSHPIYPYFAMTTGVGFQERHVLYDAERDAVYSHCSWLGDHMAKTPSTINRYAYDQASGKWAMTSSYVPDLWDIALSPDGKYLIALSKARLWLLDPVTFSALDFADFTQSNFGTAGQLGVANDGKVLIRDLGKAYSLVRKSFSAAVFPGGIGIVFSADGSRGVVGDANTSDSVPLSIYDAGTGLITPSKAFEYFQLPSIDRTGSRYFSGGNLRDGKLSLIGGVPTYMAFMRVDGKRAYEIDSTTRTHIHVYDLVGNGPSFPQLDDLVLPNTIDSYWLHGSLDSRFLLIPGPEKFIVAPLAVE